MCDGKPIAPICRVHGLDAESLQLQALDDDVLKQE
jgi:hypothetical protein